MFRTVSALLPPTLLLGGLFAPALATFATSPPAVVRAEPPRTPVIHVEAFEDLGFGGCLPAPPLHLGPSSVIGQLTNEASLRARITEAVSRCDRDWFGAVEVTVKIDDAGTIRDVRTDAGADGQMRTCVIRNVMHEGPVEARGPGALTIGYFMR